ncbi:MAG: PIN domain-containing protein [Algisphaera sp.]
MLFTVILDANVLAPAYLRDLLLEMAHRGIFRARWTPDIQDEVRRTLIARLGVDKDKVDRLINLMHENVLQPMVSSYEPLIDGLNLPDPDDRHVLAAAIVSEADTIVTYNLKDFPQPLLSEHGIVAIHPDEFLASQITLRPGPSAAAVRQILNRMTRPQFDTNDLLNRYRRSQLSHTADALAELLTP